MRSPMLDIGLLALAVIAFGVFVGIAEFLWRV